VPKTRTHAYPLSIHSLTRGKCFSVVSWKRSKTEDISYCGRNIFEMSGSLFEVEMLGPGLVYQFVHGAMEARLGAVLAIGSQIQGAVDFITEAF
jgi:hypothetical protein